LCSYAAAIELVWGCEPAALMAAFAAGMRFAPAGSSARLLSRVYHGCRKMEP
jgi:hypothetical protein